MVLPEIGVSAGFWRAHTVVLLVCVLDIPCHCICYAFFCTSVSGLCSVLLSISTVSWTCTHVRSARGHVLVRARPALAHVLLHVMVLLRVLLARLL